MLPYLKRKQDASVLPADVVERKPDNEEKEELDFLEGCIQELISAIKSGDAKAAASAFHYAFQICDAMPHEEGEHIE